jgi:plasmid stabilization system protein ParE
MVPDSDDMPIGRHIIFYQVEDQGILVVRVLHQMMDFDRHLD